jgi:hypothetical protein
MANSAKTNHPWRDALLGIVLPALIWVAGLMMTVAGLAGGIPALITVGIAATVCATAVMFTCITRGRS